MRSLCDRPLTVPTVPAKRFPLSGARTPTGSSGGPPNGGSNCVARQEENTVGFVKVKFITAAFCRHALNVLCPQEGPSLHKEV